MNLLTSSTLQGDNIIVRGDLNFSMCFVESWGHNAQMDTLLAFFENLLDSHNIIDIPTAKIQPTWRNNRTREASLARRLDHFLI